MPNYPGIAAVASQIAAPSAPLYISHGTGSGQSLVANPLTPGLPSTAAAPAALDWFYLAVGIRSSVAGMMCPTPADWTLLYNDVTTLSARMRLFIFRRQWDGVFAMPSLTWGDGAGTTPAARARIFAVRGSDGVPEGANVAVNTIASGTIAIPSVTTLGANRLVLAFFAYTLASATTGDATGTTGGTYTQPIAAYTAGGGGGAGIGLQVATLAATGTIANGSITLASGTANSVCRAFALQPG